MYLLEVRTGFSGHSTYSLPETLRLLPVTKAVLCEADFNSLPPTLVGLYAGQSQPQLEVRCRP